MRGVSSNAAARALTNRRRLAERGYALMTFAFAIVMLVTAIGLAIDSSIMYLVQTKLSSAVDAAALAGARSLSRGANDAAQTQSAKDTAAAYLAANFPNKWFGSFNLQSRTDVDVSQPNIRSVSTRANVQVRLYFMHWYKDGAPKVGASATATRRDVNVSMVIDRSGSLATSNSCDPMKLAATRFVDKFSEGRDNVGLITFATSSLADFPAANNFKSAAKNIPGTLNQLTCIGGTNAAQGLWDGYRQITKLKQPAALNVMLFFTDGQPTALTQDYPILNTSSCTIKTPKRGVLAAASDLSDLLGLMDPVGRAQPMTSDTNVTPNSGGCTYNNSWNRFYGSVEQDVAAIPVTDANGSSLIGYLPVPNTGTYLSNGVDRRTAATDFQNGATNAAANAALRIRRGDTNVDPGIPNVIIFAIGLGNAASPPDDNFLLRVSNAPNGANFDSHYWPGQYIKAPTAADLDVAFTQVASMILRLAK